MRLLGLDGCKRNAWVIAESDSDFGHVHFRVETDVTALFDDSANGRAVVILDVPIGLIHGTRACDEAARVMLRHRHVCVFTPPCREALAAASYEEAVAANRLHCDGTAISLQAFNIRERIKAVDDLMTPAHQERIREGHPEVVFAALNGGRPLKNTKDTEEGIGERMVLLRKAGVPSFDPSAERARLGRGEVALDDIVDAAAMLLTARHVISGTAERLPLGGGQRDERGLLMEMWTPAAQPPGTIRSTSGVRLYDDFRNNLIIDRYHADLAVMRGSKRDRLRSENSEDALTWNVFRSLNQIDPGVWLPLLRQKAFPDSEPAPTPQIVTMHLWKEVEPPPALRLYQRDEGASEIDVVIETEFSVWFIEAKFKSDISTGTTNNPTRDQIVRNLDVGSWYAGVRDFYFALLIMDEERSPKGVEVLNSLGGSPPTLPHRPDGLQNVKGCGLLRWRDIAGVLRVCADDGGLREGEAQFARNAWSWMQQRGLC